MVSPGSLFGRTIAAGALLIVALPGCGYFDREQRPTASTRSSTAKAAELPPTLALAPDEPERVTAQRPAAPQRFASGFRAMDLTDTTIDALARIGSDAVDPLIEALRDPEPMVRAAAARSLAVIGPEASRAVPALMQALDDRDDRVRIAAARALGQIGPAAREAVPALLEVLRTEAVRQQREESR